MGLRQRCTLPLIGGQGWSLAMRPGAWSHSAAGSYWKLKQGRNMIKLAFWNDHVLISQQSDWGESKGFEIPDPMTMIQLYISCKGSRNGPRNGNHCLLQGAVRTSWAGKVWKYEFLSSLLSPQLAATVIDLWVWVLAALPSLAVYCFTFPSCKNFLFVFVGRVKCLTDLIKQKNKETGVF